MARAAGPPKPPTAMATSRTTSCSAPPWTPAPTRSIPPTEAAPATGPGRPTCRQARPAAGRSGASAAAGVPARTASPGTARRGHREPPVGQAGRFDAVLAGRPPAAATRTGTAGRPGPGQRSPPTAGGQPRPPDGGGDHDVERAAGPTATAPDAPARPEARRVPQLRGRLRPDGSRTAGRRPRPAAAPTARPGPGQGEWGAGAPHAGRTAGPGLRARGRVVRPGRAGAGLRSGVGGLGRPGSAERRSHGRRQRRRAPIARLRTARAAAVADRRSVGGGPDRGTDAARSRPVRRLRSVRIRPAVGGPARAAAARAGTVGRADAASRDRGRPGTGLDTRAPQRTRSGRPVTAPPAPARARADRVGGSPPVRASSPARSVRRLLVSTGRASTARPSTDRASMRAEPAVARRVRPRPEEHRRLAGGRPRLGPGPWGAGAPQAGASTPGQYGQASTPRTRGAPAPGRPRPGTGLGRRPGLAGRPGTADPGRLQHRVLAGGRRSPAGTGLGGQLGLAGPGWEGGPAQHAQDPRNTGSWQAAGPAAGTALGSGPGGLGGSPMRRISSRQDPRNTGSWQAAGPSQGQPWAAAPGQGQWAAGAPHAGGQFPPGGRNTGSWQAAPDHGQGWPPGQGQRPGGVGGREPPMAGAQYDPRFTNTGSWQAAGQAPGQGWAGPGQPPFHGQPQPGQPYPSGLSRSGLSQSALPGQAYPGRPIRDSRSRGRATRATAFPRPAGPGMRNTGSFGRVGDPWPPTLGPRARSAGWAARSSGSGTARCPTRRRAARA